MRVRLEMREPQVGWWRRHHCPLSEVVGELVLMRSRGDVLVTQEVQRKRKGRKGKWRLNYTATSV
jgi:hypothetical protein